MTICAFLRDLFEFGVNHEGAQLAILILVEINEMNKSASPFVTMVTFASPAKLSCHEDLVHNNYGQE